MRLSEARALLAAMARPDAGRGKLDLSFDGEVAHLRIDHPSARSALSLSMMVDLADAIERLTSFSGRLLVLSSTDPRSFCSGGDLSDLLAALAAPDRALEMTRAMSCVLASLKDLPLVSVAAIDGAAIGGGAELATAVDLRVAGPEARLQFVQGRLGIAPGFGGTSRLVQIVGRQAALRLLLTGRAVGPGEAVSMGLVDHRCDGPALSGALAWLSDLFEMPLPSVRAIKQQIAAASPTPLADGDGPPFAEIWGGPAHREALARLGFGPSR